MEKSLSRYFKRVYVWYDVSSNFRIVKVEELVFRYTLRIIIRGVA
jgi:hypothetical protein